MAKRTKNRHTLPPVKPESNGEQQQQSQREAAKLALERDRQQRIAACSAEIEECMKRHNCDMALAMIVAPQGNIPRIEIVAKD